MVRCNKECFVNPIDKRKLNTMFNAPEWPECLTRAKHPTWDIKPIALAQQSHDLFAQRDDNTRSLQCELNLEKLPTVSLIIGKTICALIKWPHV